MQIRLCPQLLSRQQPGHTCDRQFVYISQSLATSETTFINSFLKTNNMAGGLCVLFITICITQTVYGATTKKNEEYLPLKYPGKIQDVSNRYGMTSAATVKLDSGVPDECKGQNFCAVKPPDYPQEKFNEMFKGTKIVSQPSLVTVGDRQGDPEDQDNCETEVKYEPLYKVRARTGEWRTVVQAPEENYVQLVRLETCKQAGGACFTAFPLAPDVVTFCKQKYSVWEFLVTDDKNGTEKVQSELPVCCSCHYKTKNMSDRRK